MDTIEARILLKNLLKRVREVEKDVYELKGTLTDDEVDALKLAIGSLENNASTQELSVDHAKNTSLVENIEPLQSPPNSPEPDVTNNEIDIDFSVLEMTAAKTDRRLCIDFGTAMSKVALVRDSIDSRDYEDIEVLELGVPGDQEEVSETMLISSVYIDDEGVLWFGNMAVQRSLVEAPNSNRLRLDNIKRFLSDDGLHSSVAKTYNPTDIDIKYVDMLTAYLMFLTWTINISLKESREVRNINRRFAMPCFESSKSRSVESILSTLLGEAQVLADTFFNTINNGIPLRDFIEALGRVRAANKNYNFVEGHITEPLGVAGSLLSWNEDMNSLQSLTMVIDIGAGTSDFTMFRLGYDKTTKKSTAFEVENSSEGITEAGNHLDKLLSGLILQEANIDSAHPLIRNIIGNLELSLRDYKETLFREEEVSIQLFDGQMVSITLEQFLSVSQVASFSESLKKCRDRILNRIDESFIHGAPNNCVHLVLTGGGASLPMVKDLAKGSVIVHQKEINLRKAIEFPLWLEKEYPELEDDYTRIAVSIGGARRKTIDRDGVAKVTAGDIKTPHSLGGYYSKG